ncbi:MAG: DUF1566 domain-containing protein [Bdellovibrionales bacterium]
MMRLALMRDSLQCLSALGFNLRRPIHSEAQPRFRIKLSFVINAEKKVSPERRWRTGLSSAVLAILSVLAFVGETLAATPVAGASCASDTDGAAACYLDGCYACSGGIWVAQALHIGGTASDCSSSLAGLIQWTGTAFQGCDGSSWVDLGSGGESSSTCATPDAFSFTNQTGVALNSTLTSNTVTLSGDSFTCAAMATCSGCTNIIRNGVANGTSAIFNSGDTIALQILSSSSANTAKTATVTVGNTPSGTWSVTTDSNSPDPFAFTDQTGVNLSEIITSNTVTLSGSFSDLTATCEQGCLAISRNGGDFINTSASGFQPGDTIAINQISASTLSTAKTATVTLGGTTSSSWTVTTLADPCAGTPTAGAICANGTVYAGLSPDGNVAMYTTPCDAGQAWNGSSCTGTRTEMPWSVRATIATGITSYYYGETNTDSLYALNANADGPYTAATYCHDLTQYGLDDWYLPATQELTVLYTNRSSIGNFATTGTYYWSSSENNYNRAYAQWFGDGSGDAYNKTNYYSVRCVRK